MHIVHIFDADDELHRAVMTADDAKMMSILTIIYIYGIAEP